MVDPKVCNAWMWTGAPYPLFEENPYSGNSSLILCIIRSRVTFARIDPIATANDRVSPLISPSCLKVSRFIGRPSTRTAQRDSSLISRENKSQSCLGSGTQRPPLFSEAAFIALCIAKQVAPQCYAPQSLRQKPTRAPKILPSAIKFPSFRIIHRLIR